MSEEHYELPIAISGPTSSISMGMNDNGDLDEVIFIFGGCSSPSGYTAVRTNSSNSSSNDNNNNSDNLPFSEEYRCTQISSSTYVFDPKIHDNDNDNSNDHANDKDEVKTYKAREMPRPRHKHSSISINGKIWLLGGRDAENNVIPQIDIYDSIQNSYNEAAFTLESITVPNPDTVNTDYVPYNGVSDACVFTLGTSFIVLTGGYDANYVAMGHTIIIDVDASLASLENSNDGTPELVHRVAAPLNVPRGGCAAVSHGELAYVSGGFTHADGYCEAMQSVERFDVEADKWILLSNENANSDDNGNDSGSDNNSGDGMAREGVKSLRSTGLSIGRAHHSLFYYEGHIVAFGGEKRGTYDSASGKCIDRYEAMEELTFDMNRARPNRLTFPVDSDEIELLELVQGMDRDKNVAENDYIQWVRKKTVLENNEKLRFSVVPYPSLSKVFMFGGAYSDLEAITTYTTASSSSSSSCTDCFTFSPDVDVFIDPLHDESKLFMNIVFLMLLSLSFVVFMISTSKRWCRGRQQRQQQQLLNATGSSNNISANDKRSGVGGGGADDDYDARRNEQGMLIRDDGDFWGGDAFSTDLDVEEMEWNNDLEMRQIT